jgi:hypothetical protein
MSLRKPLYSALFTEGIPSANELFSRWTRASLRVRWTSTVLHDIRDGRGGNERAMAFVRKGCSSSSIRMFVFID